MNLRLARQNPHIPRDALAAAAAVQKRTLKMRDDIRGLTNKAKKWWGGAEDTLAAGQKVWAAAGNHPDDFNDPRMSPDGHQMEKAVEFCEWLWQTVSGRPGSLSYKLDDELESMDKLLETSKTAKAKVEPVRQRRRARLEELRKRRARLEELRKQRGVW